MNILITGASRGIGLQLTRLALEKGNTVFAVVRNPESSSELQHLRDQNSSKLVLIKADLFHPEACDKISHELGNRTLDVLINNAGILRQGDSFQDFMDSIQINSVIPFFMTKALFSQLKMSNQPKVIHITSRMGSISDNKSGGHYSYRASKSALNMVNKSLSIDQPWLTAVVIHPGWVQTDMGGASAPVTPQDSAIGIWNVIHQVTKEQSGSFIDFQGQPITW